MNLCVQRYKQMLVSSLLIMNSLACLAALWGQVPTNHVRLVSWHNCAITLEILSWLSDCTGVCIFLCILSRSCTSLGKKWLSLANTTASEGTILAWPPQPSRWTRSGSVRWAGIFHWTTYAISGMSILMSAHSVQTQMRVSPVQSAAICW